MRGNCAVVTPLKSKTNSWNAGAVGQLKCRSTEVEQCVRTLVLFLSPNDATALSPEWLAGRREQRWRGPSAITANPPLWETRLVQRLRKMMNTLILNEKRRPTTLLAFPVQIRRMFQMHSSSARDCATTPRNPTLHTFSPDFGQFQTKAELCMLNSSPF